MKSLKNNLVNAAVNNAISNRTVRYIAVKMLEEQIRESILNDQSLLFYEEKLDRYYFVSTVVRQVSKCLDRKFISKDLAVRMMKVFMNDLFKINRKAHLTDIKYGEYPPKFLVLSPEKACNLECVNCYTSSCSPRKNTHHDFELTRRIVKDAHDILGSRFITISGGEPLLYHSQGKTIIDILDEFKDMFFLIYTNGKLINQKIAKKLATVGNVVPLISLTE